MARKKSKSKKTKDEDAPAESDEETSAATDEAASDPVTEPTSEADDLEEITPPADPEPTPDPEPEPQVDTGDLPECPTLDEVKKFVAGGGTLPPNLICAEHNVAGGRMVKLQGLADGAGHPKIIIPS